MIVAMEIFRESNLREPVHLEWAQLDVTSI